MAIRPPIQHVIVDPFEMQPYLSDWRGTSTGTALLVAQPQSVEEVVATVNWCRVHGLSIVPQGGNTSLAGGSIPDTRGKSVVLSLTRLNRVRSIDIASNVAIFESGVILQRAQQAARDKGRMLPLSLAAEGSCTIGGNLSTNAGGTAVLQFGNARELCLGLEVVTPDGKVISDLRALRKDNTGLNLRNLFIGAEGVLGVITAAAMRLFSLPAATLTSYVVPTTAASAIDLLAFAEDMLGSGLTAFEIMNRECTRAVTEKFPDIPLPFQPIPEYQVLIEVSDQESEERARSRLLALLERASERELISDAVVAMSLAQSDRFWALRERVAEAQTSNFKHDVSVPISRMAEFMDVAESRVRELSPSSRPLIVGHIGDGNLHYNVTVPDGLQGSEFVELRDKVEQVVHATVNEMGGSISAEHGIGRSKIQALLRYKSPVEISLMKTIKSAIDPTNMMNPGVIFESDGHA